MQIQIFESMEALSSRVDYIQRLRAKGRYNSEGVFSLEQLNQNSDILTYVERCFELIIGVDQN